MSDDVLNQQEKLICYIHFSIMSEALSRNEFRANKLHK